MTWKVIHIHTEFNAVKEVQKKLAGIAKDNLLSVQYDGTDAYIVYWGKRD